MVTPSPLGDVRNGLVAPDRTQPPPPQWGGAKGAARALGQLVSSAGAWRWAARLWQRPQAPACSWKWGPRGDGKGAGRAGSKSAPGWGSGRGLSALGLEAHYFLPLKTRSTRPLPPHPAPPQPEPAQKSWGWLWGGRLGAEGCCCVHPTVLSGDQGSGIGGGSRPQVSCE